MGYKKNYNLPGCITAHGLKRKEHDVSARWVPVVKCIGTKDNIRSKRKALFFNEEACGEKGIHGLYNKPLRCYGYF
jgi:hypothetical protein